MLNSIFSKSTQRVYYPGSYEPLINYLQGKRDDGQDGKNGLFSTIMEVMAFAACVGLKTNTKMDVTDRKDMNVSIFEGNGYGPLLFFIPLVSREEADFYLLKNGEGEETCIKDFQSYAAGGFYILSEKWKVAGLVTPDVFVEEVIRSLTIPSHVINDTAANGAPSLIAPKLETGGTEDPDDIF